MKIYEYTPGAQIDSKDTAIALGFFDGIHLAHRKLLEQTRKIAKAENLVFAVFTFPSEDKFKGEEAIYSTEQKMAILESLGVEAVILASFKAVSEISAQSFVKNSLISDMHCRAAVAGYDFRFGKGAVGNAELLSSLLSSSGAKCIIEEEMRIDGEKISTTRIKALLRRSQSQSPASVKGNSALGGIELDYNLRRIRINNKSIELTAKEFDLCDLFVSNPGKVYSRENLLDIVWGYDYPGDIRTVDVHVRRLREKIEPDAANPTYILTKWGVGYYFKEN